MKRHRTPKGYVAPLRSRASILAFLKTAEDSRPSYGLFAFNVKLGRLDWSFDLLLKAIREAGELGDVSDRYLAECRALYEDTNLKELSDRALERMREAVTDDDTHRMLWDGDEAIAEWEFNGRSGGWLVLKSFEGVELVPDRRDCLLLWERVESMGYPQLRRLYRFIVQCQHDFRQEAIDSHWLFNVADLFFLHCESRIESDEKRAARLASEAEEAAERAHWAARDTITIG